MNAALVDQLESVQVQTIIRKEETKFLLKRLCQFEPHTESEVQAAARGSAGPSNVTPVETKKVKKRSHTESGGMFQILVIRTKLTFDLVIENIFAGIPLSVAFAVF